MTDEEKNRIIRDILSIIRNVGFEPAIQKNQDKEKYNGILSIGYQEKKWEFLYILKRYLTPSNSGIYKTDYDKKTKNYLIFSEYISPTVAQEFRNLDIQYIDTAGNIYIKQLPLYIERIGKKPRNFSVKSRSNRAFNSAGMKLIYTLLCNKGLENLPYREIASIAGIANGTVAIAVKDLIKMGFLVAEGKKRTLIKKEDLLIKWVENYSLKLKDKILIGVYKSENRNYRDINVKEKDILWSGEFAGKILTNYIMPQNKTIYTEKRTANKLIAKYKLNKDENGDITLLNKFWNFESVEYDKMNVVHPILIYADLISSGDSRNIKTAQIIFDEQVKKYI